MRTQLFLSELVESAIVAATGEKAPAMLRRTADPKFGDYQANGLLPLGKRLGKNPRDLATQTAELLTQSAAFAKVEVAGPGFLNLTLRADFADKTLNEFLHDVRLGVPAVSKPEHVVVDFSSPNIAKQMHVGHLRSSILGAAMVRLLREVGHKVTGDNHLGDWGTQFGTLIVGMRRFGNEAALASDPVVELERVYKLATAAAKEDPSVGDTARAELAKLQAGDPDNRALWEHFVAVTRKSLDRVYAMLGVEFDMWMGESAYHPMLEGVVAELKERGLVREDAGALCVFFGELDSAPADLKKQKEPFIVQKADGAYLYSTTDIATLKYRHDTLKADRAIYVVDARQSLHFKQLFALAAMMGIPTKLVHPGFGSVLGEDGKPLKTRDGQAITLESLLSEATSRARARIMEEGLEIPESELDEASRTIGIGAVKYADLKQNLASDYTFDWDKMTSFKGNSGPYLQYAYARIQSIFRKGEVGDATQGAVHIEAAEEWALARELLQFPDVVHDAAEQCLPHLVSEHLYAVARAFSSFYEACPVLRAEDPRTRASRLALSALTAAQLQRGLYLLGIGTLERM